MQGQIKAPRDTPYYNYSALDHHHLLAAQPILNDADAEGSVVDEHQCLVFHNSTILTGLFFCCTQQD